MALSARARLGFCVITQRCKSDHRQCGACICRPLVPRPGILHRVVAPNVFKSGVQAAALSCSYHSSSTLDSRTLQSTQTGPHGSLPPLRRNLVRHCDAAGAESALAAEEIGESSKTQVEWLLAFMN